MLGGWLGGAAVRVLAAAACSAALVSSVAAPVRAQDEAQARALFEQGRSLANEERWIEALDAFRRSADIAERPATLFNVATTLIRLGRAQEALATITRLEAIANPRQHARVLADAAEIRARAQESLRHVTLRITPADATVEVDGAVLVGDGAERMMVLDPGAHAIVVTASGHETQRFSLEPGTDTREIVLTVLDATLRVVPSVETAAVRVDGTERGIGTIELTVPPGAHDVGIEAEGYLPFARTVELDPGATLTVDASLEIVPEEDLIQSPLFWGLVGGGTAILAGVAIGLGVAFGGSTDPLYGGTSNTIIVPLVSGVLP